MKTWKILFVLISLLLSACAPTISVNPLSQPSSVDKRLEGLWKLVSDTDMAYLHIGKTSETTMIALSVDHKENGALEISKIPFFPTQTKGNNYLNVKFEDLEDDAAKEYKGYLFVKYEFIDKDTFRLYMMDNDPIISAIQEGRLKGEITYGKRALGQIAPTDKPLSPDDEPRQTIDCVTMTDSSENILKFLESNSVDKLFVEPINFVRVKR